MKKYLLLGTSLIVASSAYAAFDCTKIPTCADLGFTMSATDCAGKNMLKCPFDTDKVFCGGCKVGAVLCDDLQCYDADNIPSDKTPIAVVFDSANRLAIGLNNAPSTMYWSSIKEDISGLTNYTSSSAALTETTTGKENTATIVALGGDYASSNYAPGYCYNLTEGGQPIGSWFLPNLKESKIIYDNKSTINTTFDKINAKRLTEAFYWTSTEYNASQARGIYMSNSDLHYNPKINGGKARVRCAIQYFK